ncbi:MarR family winged helix-turn-helix transcriptional regulator [Nocardia sp. NPDC051030]|uniref:MarR family winged helix-turn-helix transcriptional regulator n=1 Tax=Nocardia sp. NPDC051030 TaxID=3155162 RepID=UPI00343B7A35
MPLMKPIGYWLNRTDAALTSYMNAMLDEFGLTRLVWQVLNVVEDGADVPDTAIHSVLAANADTDSLNTAIATALAGNWVHRPAADRLALTEDGKQRLAAVAERVDAFRELSTAGISLDEYRTAVSVLERITANLESPSA